MLFPGNLYLLSLTLGGPVVPLVCGFNGSDNLRASRELFTNLYKLKSWSNTSIFSEFIGYADLMDCREISPERYRNNDKPKGVGKF